MPWSSKKAQASWVIGSSGTPRLEKALPCREWVCAAATASGLARCTSEWIQNAALLTGRLPSRSLPSWSTRIRSETRIWRAGARLLAPAAQAVAVHEGHQAQGGPVGRGVERDHVKVAAGREAVHADGLEPGVLADSFGAVPYAEARLLPAAHGQAEGHV